MKNIWKEFKEFAVKGNAIELAVGIVIGAAFNQVINSLVNDVVTPILSIFTGSVDFSGLKFTVFDQTLKYGSFLNTLINFLIVSFAVFILIKQVNRFRRSPQEVPNTKECPFCLSPIPLKASRCPSCTSQLS